MAKVLKNFQKVQVPSYLDMFMTLETCKRRGCKCTWAHAVYSKLKYEIHGYQDPPEKWYKSEDGIKLNSFPEHIS